MKSNFKLNIDNKLTEQRLIESCIMMKVSKIEYRPVLFFYALGKMWNVNKLIYYNNLLESIE